MGLIIHNSNKIKLSNITHHKHKIIVIIKIMQIKLNSTNNKAN
jgi:hypothetical protein